jgi:molecular chaperone GrpE
MQSMSNTNPIEDSVELSEAALAAQAADKDTPEKDTRDEEIAALKDQLLRALAEMDNTRKRADKTAADARAYAIAGFARDLLDVADNLRRAIEAVPEAERAGNVVIEGVEATERALLAAFERNGLTKIAPTDGKFDAHLHEVMFEGEANGAEAGSIIALLEPGYMLGDRLLRPARVGVAKAS